MKTGRFLLIPQSPADMDQLRRAARPLDKNTRPDWLDDSDLAYYRYVGEVVVADVAANQQALLAQEIRQAEAAGLFIDSSDREPRAHRIYVTANAEYENWSIGIYTGPSPFDLAPAPGIRQPVLTREDVIDTAAALVADPFLLQASDRWWMFFELLNWREDKGEIGLAESPDGLHWQYRQRVLVEPFHLSYPYAFQWEGRHYMVPETRQAGQVRLYRATDFPFGWECVGVLIDDCELVDASLFNDHDRWWLLAADRSAERNDLLRLFTSASLFGRWVEHPSSPVVSGSAQLARPAGRVLVDGERLFRFAQDCTSSYGREVRAVEIINLTRDSYRERVARQQPVIAAGDTGWNAAGMHHIDVHRYSKMTWLAAVDGRTQEVAPCFARSLSADD